MGRSYPSSVVAARQLPAYRGNAIWLRQMAEREGLIRSAQGCAPKPAALPLSLLYCDREYKALLRQGFGGHFAFGFRKQSGGGTGFLTRNP